MFCSTCGKEIHDKAMICPNCGCATINFVNYEHSRRTDESTSADAARSANSDLSRFLKAVFNAEMFSYLAIGTCIIFVAGIVFAIISKIMISNQKYVKLETSGENAALIYEQAKSRLRKSDARATTAIVISTLLLIVPIILSVILSN